METDLKKRTKAFALRLIRLVNALPYSIAGKNIGNQLFRCGTSVAANYRAVCLARSKAEFISKLAIVIEEADESSFWLEIIMESGLLEKEMIIPLHKESTELTAIFISSKKTTHRNKS